MKNSVKMFILIVAFVSTVFSGSMKTPIGNMDYMEYFALVRSLINGDFIDGPAKQTVISGRYKVATDWEGNLFVFDCYGLRLLMIDKEGNSRVIAGNGDVGFRDGPADQATFTIGSAAYRDEYFEIVCDGHGAVYIKDNPYIRKVYKNHDGTWMVTTVFGFGTATPKKGEWISLRSAQGFGGGSQSFDVSADGKELWCNDRYMGLIRVCLDKDSVTCLATSGEILTAGLSSGYYEPPGNCKLTMDSMFYFMIDRSTVWLSYNLRNGAIEHFAGTYPTERGYDGTWRLDARWFATYVSHSFDGSAHFSSGGDESVLRRIYQDTVKHLMKDGSWNRQNGSTNAWRISGIKGIDINGAIYCIPGAYEWPTALCRVVSNEYKTVTLPELEPPSSIVSETRKTVPFSVTIYPNPAGAEEAVILCKSHYVKMGLHVRVYGINGMLVKDFSREKGIVGEHRVVWNGRNNRNEIVPNGVYLVKVSDGQTDKAVKFLWFR